MSGRDLDVAALRDALELLAADVAAVRQSGGSRSRMPRAAELNAHAVLGGLRLVPKLQAEVDALRAAIAEPRPEPQCPVTQEAPDLRPEGASFAPSTYYCVLRLGHAGAHQFRDVAL